MSTSYNALEASSGLICRVGRLLRFRVARFLKNNKADITPEQWGLLVQLAEREGCTQGDLADPVLGDHPNVTRMLDQLSKRELVQRRPSPEDRRSHSVRLTAKGRLVLQTLLPSLAKEKRCFYDGLDERELDALHSILLALEKNLTATD